MFADSLDVWTERISFTNSFRRWLKITQNPLPLYLSLIGSNLTDLEPM